MFRCKLTNLYVGKLQDTQNKVRHFRVNIPVVTHKRLSKAARLGYISALPVRVDLPPCAKIPAPDGVLRYRHTYES